MSLRAASAIPPHVRDAPWHLGSISAGLSRVHLVRYRRSDGELPQHSLIPILLSPISGQRDEEQHRGKHEAPGRAFLDEELHRLRHRNHGMIPTMLLGREHFYRDFNDAVLEIAGSGFVLDVGTTHRFCRR